MNWDIFSPVGYASIAIWLCVPLLWLLHWLRGRGWLCHVALLLAIAAFVLARVNSQTYVNRIQADRSKQIDEQLSRQELARQAATAAREDEVAQIRFAEDDDDDFLDAAGMDESDLKYMQSFDDDATPAWKQEKKQRSAGAEDDSLEAMIGASEDTEGVEADVLLEEAPPDPILMSDSDKLAADRLDAANLTIARLLLGVAFVIVGMDYLRRANIYDQAYFPLPLPSSWVNAFTPPAPVRTWPQRPRRKLHKELQVLIKRGDSFLYLTDDANHAARVPARAYRLPLWRRRVDILAVNGEDGALDDDFVFETLWYGRNSFVVDCPARAGQMFDRFLELLAERRATRASSRQTVHIVWDLATPVSEAMRHRFANLGRVTGFALLLCREEPNRNA